MDEFCETDVILKKLSDLALNPNYSDVTFIVGSERIPAHRLVLAVRSEYFRLLLFGDFAESQQYDVKLNVPLVAFKLVLNYIYTGRMTLGELSSDIIADVFDLAHQYGFGELELAMSAYLRKKLAVDTALWTRQLAELYNLSELLAMCDRFIDDKAEQILNHQSFNTLTEDCLQRLLQRHSFKAKEINIFKAVKDWCEKHATANVTALMCNVRFSLIDLDDILNVVRPTGLVDLNILFDAIQDQRNQKKLPERVTSKAFIQPVYIAAESHYDLKVLCSVNYIKAQPVKIASAMEVSKDKMNWIRMGYVNFDYSTGTAVFFPVEPLRYIRLRNAVGEFYTVDRLEVMNSNGIKTECRTIFKKEGNKIIVSRELLTGRVQTLQRE